MKTKQVLPLFLLALLMTTSGAWADTVVLSGSAGNYYVNMPTSGTNTLTLSDASVTSFNVYDDGGDSGPSSYDCNGTLVLTAPEGYVLQLSGYLWSATRKASLTIYDNNKASGTKLAEKSLWWSEDSSIEGITSSGQSVAINFSAEDEEGESGLELTVSVLKLLVLADNADNTQPLVAGAA